MSIEGAEWDDKNKRLIFTDDLSGSLPDLMFRWRHISEKIEQGADSLVDIPTYLNKERKNIIFSV